MVVVDDNFASIFHAVGRTDRLRQPPEGHLLLLPGCRGHASIYRTVPSVPCPTLPVASLDQPGDERPPGCGAGGRVETRRCRRDRASATNPAGGDPFAGCCSRRTAIVGLLIAAGVITSSRPPGPACRLDKARTVAITPCLLSVLPDWNAGPRRCPFSGSIRLATGCCSAMIAHSSPRSPWSIPALQWVFRPRHSRPSDGCGWH